MTPDEARELFEHYEFDDERNDAEDERRRNAMRERVRVALKPLNYGQPTLKFEELPVYLDPMLLLWEVKLLTGPDGVGL